MIKKEILLFSTCFNLKNAGSTLFGFVSVPRITQTNVGCWFCTLKICLCYNQTHACLVPNWLLYIQPAFATAIAAAYKA